MESRRAAIKIIGYATLSMPLVSEKALACIYPEAIGKPIAIWTPSKYLLKFYEGKLDDFFNREYQDQWTWSNDIAVRGPDLVENFSVVPISVSSGIPDTRDVYCSQLDIVYRDERSSTLDVVYLIASFTLQRNTLPAFLTRFRMSSNKAKVYAALTFRDIRADRVIATKISSVPATPRIISCNTEYQFWYSDA